MSLLLPKYYFKSVCDITAEFLRERGISALLLDIDNTLTRDFSPELPESIERWLGYIRDAGVKCIIISNNNQERAAAFAQKCALPYIARAHKPRRRSFYLACEILGCDEKNAAMVGDQLFTDIAFGNRARCTTIFVEPMGEEKLAFVKFKRLLEKPLMYFVRKREVKL